MPSYRYKCQHKECGHIFDEFYYDVDAHPEYSHCPVCGFPAKRLITGGTGFILRGPGWSSSSKQDRRKNG